MYTYDSLLTTPCRPPEPPHNVTANMERAARALDILILSTQYEPQTATLYVCVAGHLEHASALYDAVDSLPAGVTIRITPRPGP